MVAVEITVLWAVVGLPTILLLIPPGRATETRRASLSVQRAVCEQHQISRQDLVSTVSALSSVTF